MDNQSTRQEALQQRYIQCHGERGEKNHYHHPGGQRWTPSRGDAWFQSWHKSLKELRMKGDDRLREKQVEGRAVSMCLGNRGDMRGTGQTWSDYLTHKPVKNPCNLNFEREFLWAKPSPSAFVDTLTWVAEGMNQKHSTVCWARAGRLIAMPWKRS